jgi:hypothetical protein
METKGGAIESFWLPPCPPYHEIMQVTHSSKKVTLGTNENSATRFNDSPTPLMSLFINVLVKKDIQILAAGPKNYAFHHRIHSPLKVDKGEAFSSSRPASARSRGTIPSIAEAPLELGGR